MCEVSLKPGDFRGKVFPGTDMQQIVVEHIVFPSKTIPCIWNLR